MFTEGLDDKAICWVKQGSEVAQNPRSPMIEKCPLGSILNAPLLHKSSNFLSPKVLPHVKFHSGFLGLEPRTYAEDSEDDSMSVASVSAGQHAYCSDAFEEDGWESSDASLSVRRKDQCLEEENIDRFESATVSSRGTRSASRHTLVRGLSKENLKVEIPINVQHMGRYDSSSSLQNDCMLKRFEELGTPSAPPIVDTGREEGMLGENAQANLVSFEISSVSKHHIHCTNDTATRDVEEDETCPWQNKFSNQSKCYYASAETSWQAFVAYDACFRLCLNSWTRDCTEAQEFLRDECMILRDAFGIQKYLLQPRGHVRGECMPINNAEGVCATKDGKAFEKIEVEVRKIKITPQRRKLQSTFSTPTLAMHAGTEYVCHVAEVLWNRVNALKPTSFPDSSEEALSCLFQLKHFNEVAVADSSSLVLLTPGTTESHVFYPESQEEVLFFQVQNINKANLGHGRIPVSLLVSEAQQGCKVKWWPIYLEEQGCVGKIQLSINISGCSDKINNKGGHAVETIIYDLVVEASMRANNFSSKNLQIHGPWEWLLDEFAKYYGVTPAYKNLRYLSHVMNIAIPTKECLELIHDLLVPVLKARSEKILTRQERSILFDCEDQIKNLLTITFQNYKSLDGHSSTGLATTIGSIPETVSPVLPPAMKLFNLLHDILSPEVQNMLKNYFKIAATKRCRRHFADSEEFMSSNCDATEPIAISTAYSKMKTLCVNISNEIQADMKIQNDNILPTCIDLPNIAASVYSIQLRLRLENFLSVFPPSRPAPHVTELLIATSDFERDLNSWNISSINGGVVSRDLFHNYIEVWIEDTRYHLVGICKCEKIPCIGTHHVTSPFVENMYDHIRESLNEYKVVINRWPQYLLSIESAVTHVERAIVKSLEKQYNDFLIPLKDRVSKKIEKHVHKLTRRQSVSAYIVPKELGIFLDTMKRIIDVHHCKVEDALKSAASFLVLSNGKENFGDRMSGFAIMSRTNYKNYKQSIIKMLVNNTEANRSTRLKRILEETKEAKAEAEIRERMQLLCIQLTDSIQSLHHVFTSKIFVEICRGFWDKMGQIVLCFLESRKENKIWYRGSGYALEILDNLFASEMQKLQGNSIHDKDLEPPRSVVEARSILC